MKATIFSKRIKMQNGKSFYINVTKRMVQNST